MNPQMQRSIFLIIRNTSAPDYLNQKEIKGSNNEDKRILFATSFYHSVNFLDFRLEIWNQD